MTTALPQAWLTLAAHLLFNEILLLKEGHKAPCVRMPLEANC